jgi:hypothetical protein
MSPRDAHVSGDQVQDVAGGGVKRRMQIAAQHHDGDLHARQRVGQIVIDLTHLLVAALQLIVDVLSSSLVDCSFPGGLQPVVLWSSSLLERILVGRSEFLVKGALLSRVAHVFLGRRQLPPQLLDSPSSGGTMWATCGALDWTSCIPRRGARPPRIEPADTAEPNQGSNGDHFEAVSRVSCSSGSRTCLLWHPVSSLFDGAQLQKQIVAGHLQNVGSAGRRLHKIGLVCPRTEGFRGSRSALPRGHTGPGRPVGLLLHVRRWRATRPTSPDSRGLAW